MDEHVDIVDEQNKVVGSSSKKEAHEKGFLHKTVIAEVMGTDGNWTLVKQASDRQDAGQFVSPVGGHVQSGETDEDALRREAYEEYGLSGIFLFRYVGKKIFNREVRGRKENHYFILYEIITDEKPILNNESVDFKRFSREELKKGFAENPKQFGDAFHFIVQTFYPELLI